MVLSIAKPTILENIFKNILEQILIYIQIHQNVLQQKIPSYLKSPTILNI